MKHFYFTFFMLFSLIQFGFTQSNQYLHFDGTDDYTSLPNGSQFVASSNTISMAGWFYTDELVYGQGMMSIRGGGIENGEMYVIQLSNGTLECRVVTNTGLHQFVGPAGTIQAGVWQHVAWVFNQNTVELFIDGVSIGSSPASGYLLATDRPFTIGTTLLSGSNFFFGGRADEVSLWSKALSQAEIQDMMNNELNGDEANLEAYYKFNQGTPGGNNTNITELIAEGGDFSRNSELLNFALTGETSNFNGTLEAGFQAINFPLISTKLITDSPFQLNASSNSGLPITYEIVSGPATVSGNLLTLDGTAGEVVVKASQAGNSEWDPASDVYVTFDVIDPALIEVNTTALHPLSGNVYNPNLIPIEIAIFADVEYSDVFEIASVDASIDGSDIALTNHGNGFYTGWWTPPTLGNFDFEIVSSHNLGTTSTENFNINITDATTTTDVLATDQVWVYGDHPTETVEADLPSFSGAYNQIMGTLTIGCPTGGCDPWDRVSSVEVQGKDGEWFEIIRYLTPYSVACESEIDLTDFASLLQGKTKFRVNLGTVGNGFTYTLSLNYQAGIPEHPFSKVKKLWNETFQFGDPGNLQPVPQLNLEFEQETQAAKIKLVSSGHGWGDNNTGNAAEFQANTHHVWVNNAETFSQYNWQTCNPNPDGCQPQAGTWYFPRAGWCPGSIAQFFDFDMNAFVSQPSVLLDYVFDESYVDQCHANNPNCVSGVTCPNCEDGFNPHLIVASYLITFGDSPLENLTTNEVVSTTAEMQLYPNPTAGKFFLSVKNAENAELIDIYDMTGRLIKRIKLEENRNEIEVNLRGVSPGVYIVTLLGENGIIGSKRLIME